MVRLALLASLMCSPPVSFHTSQLSMVPNASRSPSVAASGTLSNIQRILVPEK